MTHRLASRLCAIRAITFDVDDTLWDLGAAIAGAHEVTLRELHAQVGADAVPDVGVETLAALREEAAREMEHLRDGAPGSWLEDVRRESLRRLVAGLDVDDRDALAARLAEVFFARRFGDVVLIDGTHEALATLRDHYRIGLVSNGNSSMAGTAVGTWFACDVRAGDHGWAKPDARMFEVAAERLGCAAHEVLHVGDSLPEDVAGAQAADMLAAWFNPHGLANGTDVVPDLELRHLSELVDLLVRPGGTGDR